MFTEQSLRDHPSLVKAFRGIEAEQFWELIEHMSEQVASDTQHHRQRGVSQGAVGGGRSPDLSLSIRSALLLTSLRLHLRQATLAALFVGATQSDVWRDLRRLLPLMEQQLRCPIVWQEVAADQAVPQTTPLRLEDLAAGGVLVEATEQPVARPKENTTQKAD